MIKKLKLERSRGPDVLLNEYFIRFGGYYLPIIHTFLNRIFKTGSYPQTESEPIIDPILKKDEGSIRSKQL